MKGWKERARLARRALRHAKHGQREATLASITNDRNVNTLRREVKALVFLDGLRKSNPDLSRRITDLSFDAIEVLARWHAFDPRGAVNAAYKLASGEHSLNWLKTEKQVAERQRSEPVRKDTLRDAEPLVRKQIAKIFGMRLGPAQISTKKLDIPPIDFLFQLNRSDGPTETIAALIVGPYQNRDLYLKRRPDQLLKAMGLAWIFDHVVVVLPPPARVDEYRRWLNKNALVETAAKVRLPLSDRTRKPNVYVVDLPKPLASSRI
jgi:hypothetical protein